MAYGVDLSPVPANTSDTVIAILTFAKRRKMTILQTALVFVGIPMAVFVILAGLIYRPGTGKTKRYRPGGEYDFAPIWLLARPEDVSVAAAADYVAAIPATTEAKAIEAGPKHSRTGIKGGASGTW